MLAAVAYSLAPTMPPLHRLKRPKHLCAASCLALLATGLAGCGASTVSTSAFKGEEHEVAQTVSNLQSDATTGEVKKVCTNDLDSALVTRLGGVKACEAAIKNQLAEIDNLEVSVESVHVISAGARPTASAQVKSIHSGKSGPSTLLLVKEDGKWKISGMQ